MGRRGLPAPIEAKRPHVVTIVTGGGRGLLATAFGLPDSPDVRLFVAVRPPETVIDVVASLPRPEHPGVRWTTRAQWHLTLRFLGEVDDPGPVAAALAAAPLHRCTAVMGPRVTVLGRGVLVVPVEGLGELAAAVALATAGHGGRPETRPFRGHLTLARAPRTDVRSLVGAPVEASFAVDEVQLVRSHLGAGGARYEDLFVRRLDRVAHGP